jgi:hypothetical protein
MEDSMRPGSLNDDWADFLLYVQSVWPDAYEELRTYTRQEATELICAAVAGQRVVWRDDAICWFLKAQPVRYVDLRAEGVTNLVRHVQAGHLVAILSEDAELAHKELLSASYAALDQYEAVEAGQADATVFRSAPDAAAAESASSFVKPTSTTWHRDLYQHYILYRERAIGGVGRMPEIESLDYSEVSERRVLAWLDIPATVRDYLDDHTHRDFDVLCQPRFAIDPKYHVADQDLATPGPFRFIHPDAGVYTAHIGGSVHGTDPDAQLALEEFMGHAVTAHRAEVTSGVCHIGPALLTAHRGLRRRSPSRTVLTRRLYRRRENLDL